MNAKGAREKPPVGDPRACRIAQCRTTKQFKKRRKRGRAHQRASLFLCWFLEVVLFSKKKKGRFGDWVFLLLETTRTKHPITPPNPFFLLLEEKRGLIQPTGRNEKRERGEREARACSRFFFSFSFFFFSPNTTFFYGPECGRTTR